MCGVGSYDAGFLSDIHSVGTELGIYTHIDSTESLEAQERMIASFFS